MTQKQFDPVDVGASRRALEKIAVSTVRYTKSMVRVEGIQRRWFAGWFYLTPDRALVIAAAVGWGAILAPLLPGMLDHPEIVALASCATGCVVR